MKNKINYGIYYPSGNITALVEKKITDDKLKSKINNKLMKLNPSIEQVGFVWQKDQKFFLEMAGGEMSGNAARTAVYYFLNWQKGIIELNVIGLRNCLQGSVNNNLVSIEMPFYKTSDKYLINKNYSIIKLPGISYLIVSAEKYPKRNKKKVAGALIEKYLKDNSPAKGVVFTNKETGGYKIIPVVKVEKVNTLIVETACGSGSLAVAINNILRGECSNPVKILQPTEEIINVSLEIENNVPISAFISGKVRKIVQGCLTYNLGINNSMI